MEVTLTESAQEFITNEIKDNKDNHDLAIGLYAVQRMGWGGGYLDVAVSLDEIKTFTEKYKERFNKIGLVQSVPVFIDEYAQKLLDGRDEVAIQAFGWSFTKHLGLVHSARRYFGRGSSCTL